MQKLNNEKKELGIVRYFPRTINNNEKSIYLRKNKSCLPTIIYGIFIFFALKIIFYYFQSILLHVEKVGNIYFFLNKKQSCLLPFLYIIILLVTLVYGVIRSTEGSV